MYTAGSLRCRFAGNESRLPSGALGIATCFGSRARRDSVGVSGCRWDTAAARLVSAGITGSARNVLSVEA